MCIGSSRHSTQEGAKQSSTNWLSRPVLSALLLPAVNSETRPRRAEILWVHCSACVCRAHLLSNAFESPSLCGQITVSALLQPVHWPASVVIDYVHFSPPFKYWYGSSGTPGRNISVRCPKKTPEKVAKANFMRSHSLAAQSLDGPEMDKCISLGVGRTDGGGPVRGEWVPVLWADIKFIPHYWDKCNQFWIPGKRELANSRGAAEEPVLGLPKFLFSSRKHTDMGYLSLSGCGPACILVFFQNFWESNTQNPRFFLHQRHILISAEWTTELGLQSSIWCFDYSKMQVNVRQVVSVVD